MTRALLQQALEFTEFLWREVSLNDYTSNKLDVLMEALRAELAKPEQPAQEPLFWYQDGLNGTFVGPIPNEVIEQGRKRLPGEWKPLFGGIGGKA